MAEWQGLFLKILLKFQGYTSIPHGFLDGVRKSMLLGNLEPFYAMISINPWGLL